MTPTPTPYELGAQAFNDNKMRGSNPYPKGTPEHDEWSNGWDESSTNYNASNIIN